MQKINYQKMLDDVIEKNRLENKKPKLLLHACCAPCSSYVLEYLNSFFEITMFFYNPNISPKSEFDFRLSELKRLIKEMNLNIKVLVGEYDSDLFYKNSTGLESQPEGGERCFKCYEMRLKKTAETAKNGGFDYFTTTLSISPYKNAEKLNEIGGRLSEEYGVDYLYSDFKKKNGYKRSIELSKIYSLYRQDYCGCVFSKEITRKLREEREKKTRVQSFASPVGYITVTSDSHYLKRIEFCKNPCPDDPDDITRQTVKELKEYFAGERKEFDIPFSPDGTDFQKKVWNALLDVPYGESATYKDIALKIGNENACRAVGGANNKNPIPIIIPCHRIIGSSGTLVGYAYGVNIKQQLLNIERSNTL